MTSVAPDPAADGASALVGGYTLLTKIGEGGMGIVHLARRGDGPRVALKVLRPHIVGDDEARRRLAREVGSLRRIRSTWVAEIVDADPWAPVPYVATRYVPGLSLHDHVREEGPVDGADLLWFAGCLAEGLDSVHDAGVLHRDVKPSNVLMEGRTPILIDFGLARVADDPKLTHTGWLLGTPGYLAPEILYGDDATPASDVHSWAATVAFAATGRAVFGRGPSMAIMDRVRRGEHDLAGLDGPLRDVVAAALDPEPEHRPTLAALLDWLRPQTTRPGPLLGAPPTARDRLGESFDDSLRLAATGLEGADDDTIEQDAVPAPTLVEPVGVTLPYPEDAPPVPPPVVRPVAPPAPVAAPAAVPPPVYRPSTPSPAFLPPPVALQPGPWAEPGPPPTPLGERLRRHTLVVAGCLAVGGAVAAFPWPALVVVLTTTWLLRSGSLAASAAGDRRRLRGRKWYDGMQLLVAAPWHLLQSIPATLVLLLWAGGLATSAGLICYAAAASDAVTLGIGGAVLAFSLWTGPGGSRLRSPVSRVVNPLSRGLGTWLLVLLAVLVLAALLGLLAQTDGVNWMPASDRPL